MSPLCCWKSVFKPVTHVIFDLDGTILDTEKVYSSAISQVAEMYDKEVSEEVFMKIAGSTLSDTCKIAVSELDLPITPEEFEEKFKELSFQNLATCEYMPGAERLIKHFYDNDVPLAIATSSTEEELHLKFENKKEVYNMFHHIVCGSTDKTVKRGKPAPDIFLICASRFRDMPNPVKCLVFEDSINGMKGALAAGMQIVLTPEPMVPYESWKLATMRLDSLEQFVPEFFNLPRFPSTEEPPMLSRSFFLVKGMGEEQTFAGYASETSSEKGNIEYTEFLEPEENTVPASETSPEKDNVEETAVLDSEEKTVPASEPENGADFASFIEKSSQDGSQESPP